MLPAVDNSLCLRCHEAFGFATDEAISAHTHHSVDPAGSGASRCTACHMPPLEQAADGYANFKNHQDDYTKVVLKPGMEA